MKKYLLALLIPFFLLTPVHAQQGLQKVKIDRFEGGMNSNDSSDILEANQGASMVNVVVNRLGKISKRKGQALFNTDTGSTAFRGIGRFDPDRTTSYLVIASDTSVARATSTATGWTLANAASPLTAGQNTEFIQANDKLFVINGFDSTAWYTGSDWIESGTYPTSPPTATTGAWLRNYLFLGGATTEADWVYFSNNLDPVTFTSGDIIPINTGDGQAIQRMLPYRLNELIIYKERSIFDLDLTGTTPLTDWTVQPISTTVGTIAPKSVVSLGNDQWFLSSEPIAVRSLVRTNFDKILLDTVSRPIQDVFDRTGSLQININYIDKACAVLFNNKYILAVPTGTSTVNNTVFVHDFFSEAWYRIDGWFPSAWIEFDNRLFYADANDGRVVECFTGTTGDMAKGPSSASEPTVGINFQYISKVIDFDVPENFKQPDAIEVEFEPTGSYEAVVYTNLDNNGWASVGSVNLAGNTLTLPFDLPAVLNAGGTARKTFQNQSQGEFKKMWVRVENASSGQSVILERITVFAVPKQWRRE